MDSKDYHSPALFLWFHSRYLSKAFHSTRSVRCNFLIRLNFHINQRLRYMRTICGRSSFVWNDKACGSTVVSVYTTGYPILSDPSTRKLAQSFGERSPVNSHLFGENSNSRWKNIYCFPLKWHRNEIVYCILFSIETLTCILYNNITHIYSLFITIFVYI